MFLCEVTKDERDSEIVDESTKSWKFQVVCEEGRLFKCCLQSDNEEGFSGSSRVKRVSEGLIKDVGD